MNTGKFVAYYRVSTARQGQSGLGLEAQQKAVRDYLNGGSWELIEEHVEIESGKRQKNRPKLLAAVATCRQQKATLIIAKLDRLSRNAGFLLTLRDSGVEVRAVDMPHAGTLEFGVRAIVAQHEREEISRRTKDALAAAKARGVKLGQHGKILAREHQADAQQRAQAVGDVIRQIRASGFTTVRAITAELNRRQVPTAKGGSWHVPSTYRLLKRLSDTVQS